MLRDRAVITPALAAFYQFSTEAWVLLGIGIAITILRVFAKIKSAGFRYLGADDYLALLAIIFYIAETTLVYCTGHITHGISNKGMTDAQRAALSPDSEEYYMRLTDPDLGP